MKLSERRAERLNYLGVSFGLTADLLRFWKKIGYVPVYLRQTANELTGEHSCIMLKELDSPAAELSNGSKPSWLYQYFADFRRRFLSLLGYQFRVFLPAMCLNVIKQEVYAEQGERISKQEADRCFNSYDVKRLEQYAMNLVDYHLVIDLVPQIARLYFTNQLGADFSLSLVQSAILIGLGLEHKTLEELERELQLPPNQMLAMFNKIVKKVIALLEDVSVKELGALMFKARSQADEERLDSAMRPLAESLEHELAEAAAKVKAKEADQKRQLLGMTAKLDLKQYEIKGTENEWTDALKLPATSSYVTVKR